MQLLRVINQLEIKIKLILQLNKSLMMDSNIKINVKRGKV
jgi:hypothetical protein